MINFFNQLIKLKLLINKMVAENSANNSIIFLKKIWLICFTINVPVKIENIIKNKIS